MIAVGMSRAWDPHPGWVVQARFCNNISITRTAGDVGCLAGATWRAWRSVAICADSLEVEEEPYKPCFWKILQPGLAGEHLV